MKILYVEDELHQNIPRIVDLFGDFIGKKACATLERFEHDPDGFGATNEEIAAVLAPSPVDVAYTLTEAIDLIVNGRKDKYDLFVIDRNLADGGFFDADREEIEKWLPKSTEADRAAFMTREGDFLIWVLDLHGIDWEDSAFFLTANADEADQLRSHDLLKVSSMLGRWHKANVIEKGDNTGKARLKDALSMLPVRRLSKDFPYQYRTAEALCGGETPKLLMQVVGATESPKWGEMKQSGVNEKFTQIRLLLEALLTQICKLDGVEVQPDEKGNIKTASRLYAIRNSAISSGRRPLEEDENLNYWTKTEDNAASLIWDLCSPMLHNESRTLYYASDWDCRTLYALAYHAILHLYEWAGRSNLFLAA